MIVIGFSGPQHSGKSTAINNVVTEINNRRPYLVCDTLEENIQYCPLPVNEYSGFYSQLWILTNHISSEINKRSMGADILLTDRTIYDPSIYSTCARDNNRITYEEWKMLVLNFVEGIGEHLIYDTIYLFPPLPFDIENDGVRSTNKKFQERVWELFKEFPDYYPNYNPTVLDPGWSTNRLVNDILEIFDDE